MTGGSDAADGLPGGTSATAALENAVEESRREYDKKVATMEEIDDKAMRSVRTAVIVVGLVVSAVSVGGPAAVGDIAPGSVLVAGSGIVALSASIVYGIGAYTVTQYPTGIGSPHREALLQRGYGKNEWLAVMLVEYGRWSDEIADEIQRNHRYLEITQVALSFGVVALLVAAAALVVNAAYGVRPVLTTGIVVPVLFVVQNYLSYNS